MFGTASAGWYARRGRVCRYAVDKNGQLAGRRAAARAGRPGLNEQASRPKKGRKKMIKEKGGGDTKHNAPPITPPITLLTSLVDLELFSSMPS